MISLRDERNTMSLVHMEKANVNFMTKYSFSK